MALKPKQKLAIDLLTSGKGLSYKEICAEVGVSEKTLWSWRNEEQFVEFQDELERINKIRWEAAEDAARQAAIELCKEKNAKFVEFVLKNIGYNPSQKLEADVSADIVLNIGESAE